MDVVRHDHISADIRSMVLTGFGKSKEGLMDGVIRENGTPVKRARSDKINRR